MGESTERPKRPSMHLLDAAIPDDEAVTRTTTAARHRHLRNINTLGQRLKGSVVERDLDAYLNQQSWEYCGTAASRCELQGPSLQPAIEDQECRRTVDQGAFCRR